MQAKQKSTFKSFNSNHMTGNAISCPIHESEATWTLSVPGWTVLPLCVQSIPNRRPKWSTLFQCFKFSVTAILNRGPKFSTLLRPLVLASVLILLIARLMTSHRLIIVYASSHSRALASAELQVIVHHFPPHFWVQGIVPPLLLSQWIFSLKI
jgi:hypothetical protein